MHGIGHTVALNSRNDKMFQTTKLMDTICLLTVLIIEVTTISARDKIVANSNMITIAATQKIISNSTAL